MICWCSSCNEYISETPPFRCYENAYSLCVACTQKGSKISSSSQANSEKLKAVKQMLWNAGSRHSLKDARDAINYAIRQNIRPVDLLMGLVTPILWEIGDLWSSGSITHEIENRLTVFYTSVVQNVKKYDAIMSARSMFENIDILLLNSPNNLHELGVHVLNLWLHSKGVSSSLLKQPLSFNSIVSHVERLKPKFLGFSVAMVEQLPAAIDLYQNISHHLGERCPPLLVGGNFVKESSKLPTAKNVTFIHDNSQLLKLLEKA